MCASAPMPYRRGGVPPTSQGPRPQVEYLMLGEKLDLVHSFSIKSSNCDILTRKTPQYQELLRVKRYEARGRRGGVVRLFLNLARTPSISIPPPGKGTCGVYKMIRILLNQNRSCFFMLCLLTVLWTQVIHHRRARSAGYISRAPPPLTLWVTRRAELASCY